MVSTPPNLPSVNKRVSTPLDSSSITILTKEDSGERGIERIPTEEGYRRPEGQKGDTHKHRFKGERYSYGKYNLIPGGLTGVKVN